MKYPKIILRLQASLSAIGIAAPSRFLSLMLPLSLLPFAASVADARIGESRETLERRLFASGGIVYRDPTVQEARRRGMPYLQFMELMPGSIDVRLYYKTADGRRPTSSELEEKQVQPGWDVHVVYVGGKSVIEVYKRTPGMTEYELNQLLSVYAGGSFWKKVPKEDLEPSAFGYEMIRDDGEVRAKKLGGDGILFVDSRADTRLAEARTADLIEKAPLSVEGF